MKRLLTLSLLCTQILWLSCAVGRSRNWQKVSSESRWSLAVDMKNRVFSANGNGEVFKSDDEGATWTKAGDNKFSFLSSPENPTTVAVAPDGNVFVHTSSGWIYRLKDENNSWEIVNGENNNSMKGTLAISPENHLYVIKNGLNILRSTDNGKTWTKADFVFPFLGVPKEPSHPLGSPFLRAPLLAFSSTGDIFIFVQGVGLHRSNDKGTTWQALTLPEKNTSIHCMVINPAGEIFVSTDNGVLSSIDGGLSWSSIGLDGHQVLGIATSPNGTLFAATNSVKESHIWKAAPVQ